jgi:hypothetical protein
VTAIHSCTRRLDNTNQTTFDEDGIPSLAHTDKYDIIVTSPGVDSEWVRRHAPLPPFGAYRSFDSPLTSTGEWDIRQTGPITFEADVPFVAKLPEFNPKPPNQPQPTKRSRGQLQLDISSQDNEEGIDCDINGKAVATVNGDQFDPPLTATVSDLVITIGRDVDNFDIITAANNRNKVNSAYWYGIPKGMARIVTYDGSFHVDDAGVNFWRQTVRIVVRGESPVVSNDKVWWKRVRHEGFTVLVTCAQTDAGARLYNNRYVKNCLAKVNDSDDGKTTGEFSSKPVLLNSEGFRINNPINAEWLTFQIYRETDFNSLPIL